MEREEEREKERKKEREKERRERTERDGAVERNTGRRGDVN